MDRLRSGQIRKKTCYTLKLKLNLKIKIDHCRSEKEGKNKYKIQVKYRLQGNNTNYKREAGIKNIFWDLSQNRRDNKLEIIEIIYSKSTRNIYSRNG